MKNGKNLLSILMLFLLSACIGSKTIIPATTPYQETIDLTPSLPTETLFDWCISLGQIGGLPTDDTSKDTHIVYLGTNFETGKSRDQIWTIYMGNGFEKLLLDDIPSPFLGLALLPDRYRFILLGSHIMRSDLDGSALEKVDNIDELVTDFRPYSPIWNLLSNSPEAKDARFGILHSPNGIYSAIWKPGDPALIILNKTTGRKTEIIQMEAPDSIQGGNWSPDGNFFVFAFYKNAKPYYSQIFIVNTNGFDLEPLSQPFELELLDRPIWSPDGQKIAISLLGRDGWYHIMIVNYKTGRINRFRVSPIIGTDSIQDQGEMAWSPDSKWFAYISQYGHYGIEILNVESGEIYCGEDNKNLGINMLDWR